MLTALADGGFELIGVDLSREMLKIAREKVPHAVLLHANLVELDAVRDAAFDHAACLFSTLGMMERAEYRRQIIEHVYRVLKPGGRFLLHVHNRWFHLQTAAGRRWLLRDLLRQLSGAEDAGNYVPPAASAPALHHFSLREVRRLLADTGFRIRFVDPISLRADCRLLASWLLPSLRAYGFLVGAEKSLR